MLARNRYQEPVGKSSTIMSAFGSRLEGACTVVSQYGGTASACASTYDFHRCTRQINVTRANLTQIRDAHRWCLTLGLLRDHEDIATLAADSDRPPWFRHYIGEDTVVFYATPNSVRRSRFGRNHLVMLRQERTYEPTEKRGS